jgi:hypothetical protein
MISQKPPGLTPEPGPNDEAVAGTIYNYGMTMYLIQVLEHQVVNLIVASNLPRSTKVSKEELQRIRADGFKRTMGQQLRELISCVEVPQSLRERVNRVVAERNHLAHRFFREHYDKMQSVSGNEELIRDLVNLQQIVVAVDDELTELERSVWRANGLEYPF